MQGADDLADDFVVHYNLGALSDGEDYEAILSDNGASEKSMSPGLIEKSQKKRKRREKEKERKAKVSLTTPFTLVDAEKKGEKQKRKLVEANEPIEVSVADRSPGELSNYLSSLQAESMSKLSSLELEDMLIPELSIVDTGAWTGPRTLDHLVDFIVKVLPTLQIQLSKKPKNNGSPSLLFITGAALRVADVTRVLKEKKLRGKTGGEVAKLFAKHFKLAEHVTYLKRTKIGAAVGTPGRIGKLLRDTDALPVSALSHIILDVTYKDPKKRNLLDIPETRDEVLQSVLAAPQVLQGIKGGKIQVVFF